MLGEPTARGELSTEAAGEGGLDVAAGSAFCELLPVVREEIVEEGAELGAMLEIVFGPVKLHRDLSLSEPVDPRTKRPLRDVFRRMRAFDGPGNLRLYQTSRWRLATPRADAKGLRPASPIWLKDEVRERA
jgi:hypothetical protein